MADLSTGAIAALRLTAAGAVKADTLDEWKELR